MEKSRARTIFCGFVAIAVASQVTAEFEGRNSDMLESPRVERMHSESSDGCVGNDCLAHNSEGAIGAMWFGPRLGRRRRSDLKYSGKGIEALSDVLGSHGLNFLTIPDIEDNRREMSYTSRVDRESGDTYTIRNLLHKLIDRMEDQSFGEQEQRISSSMYSSPLSHNRMSTLERELRDMLRKLDPRTL